jgi:uncharacterized protein YhbP (UPF0306 family)
MNPLPDKIRKFILENHVVSLATIDEGGVWAASCFYSFEATQNLLFILSSTLTRHGQAMLRKDHVAGTISGQPTSLHEIRGVQFSATALLLEGEKRDAALRHYLQRHPVARFKPSEIWEIRLTDVKFTDNSLSFGQKTPWTRNGV